VTVENIANALGKTTRSIVAKLSREKVYKAKEYVSKTGAPVAKKNDTADAIGAILKMTEPEIESLTKANKSALDKIFKALAESKPIDGIETAAQSIPVVAAAAVVAADPLNALFAPAGRDEVESMDNEESEGMDNEESEGMDNEESDDENNLND
jgi:hypothetical protein